MLVDVKGRVQGSTADKLQLSHNEQEAVTDVARSILDLGNYNLFIAPAGAIIGRGRRVPSEPSVAEPENGSLTERGIVYGPQVAKILRDTYGITKLFYYAGDKPARVGEQNVDGNVLIGANLVNGGRLTIGIHDAQGENPGSLQVLYSEMRKGPNQYGRIELTYALEENSNGSQPVVRFEQDKARASNQPLDYFTPLIEGQEETEINGPWEQIDPSELFKTLSKLVPTISEAVHTFYPVPLIPKRGGSQNMELLESNSPQNLQAKKAFKEAWEDEADIEIDVLTDSMLDDIWDLGGPILSTFAAVSQILR